MPQLGRRSARREPATRRPQLERRVLELNLVTGVLRGGAVALADACVADTTFDPNTPFSLDSTLRGSGVFRFPVDLNSSLDLRRPGSTTGYVTDGTSLPRTLFGDKSMSAHQVFGTASSVSMGDDDVSFPSLYVLCAL